MSRVLRALSMCAPLAPFAAPAAFATAVAPATAPAGIPAQPLARALAAFAQQTGLQIVYVSSVVANRRSHAVPAGVPASEALSRLLQGTGLRFESLTPETINILAAARPRAVAAQPPAREKPSEVIVTASRREEYVQDVPITVQAITGTQLRQLNVASFNDLLKYTPNVSYSGNGPGTGNIYMRGLGGYGSGNQSQATIAPFPNVALYLDEQSMQFPARNNDVYLVDMQRVEVLEGPQGTLVGGSAQLGAVRYVTNKPKLGIAGGEVNAAYGVTAGGDPNTLVNATLNLPFGDSLALRGVVFSERRGGYIGNVPSTIGYRQNTPSINGGPRADNAGLVSANTNPVDYQGLRLSALWKMKADWETLLQQNYQQMRADGYFYAYPTGADGRPLAKDQITAFTPAYSRDRYQSTALTLHGKASALLSLVYAGSYMTRRIEAQQDYSNYLRSYSGSYYACIGTGALYFNPANFHGPYPGLAGKPLQCTTPVAAWHDAARNVHMSHELRLTTNADHRLRGLLGLYWEKFVIYDDMNFNYLTLPHCDPVNLAAAASGGPSCLSAVGPVPGAFTWHPGLRDRSNTAFGQDDQRGYRQRAFFTSVDFDLIPGLLTITGGVRLYRYDEFETGSEYYSETADHGWVVNHANGTCTAAGGCGFPINLQKSEAGHRWRGNLTWHIAPDMMAYYTYSEGFRPGGFNRTRSLPGQSPMLEDVAWYCGSITGVPPGELRPDRRCALPVGAPGSLNGISTTQFNIPASFDSDYLVNNEIGLKSEFFEHRFLLDLSGYVMDWRGGQLPLIDPVHLGNLTFNINGPSYRVKGLEAQFVARVTEGLTLQGSSSNNSVAQTSSPCLRSNRAAAGNPTPLGDCITVIRQASFRNPYGVVGTRPAWSPPWVFNIRARYDWQAADYRPFIWAGASHIGSQSNEPASYPSEEDPASAYLCTPAPTSALCRYTIPGYTIYDAAIGVSRDNWTMQVQGTNITNVYGPTNISSSEYIKADVPLQPRVIMVRFSYAF